jgi:hypothetical protein
METELLGRAMREATAELGLPPDFTSRVVRRGRRRQVNRRVCLAAGLAVLAVLAGLPAARGGPGSTDEVSADPRLAEPTHGDLAADKQFLRIAVQAWRTGMKISYNNDNGRLFDDLRGGPHVYWAGTTPAGPAAVVLQEAHRGRYGRETLVGLVAIDAKDGRLKLVNDQLRGDHEPEPGYFQFGPGDRTILVVEHDQPLYFSPEPITQPDGRVVRDWTRMSIVDGVAVVQLPAGAEPADVRVLLRDRRPAPDDKRYDGLIRTEPASVYLYAVDKLSRDEDLNFAFPKADRTLPWRQQDEPMRVGRSPHTPADWQVTFWNALEDHGMIDIGNAYGGGGVWTVLAGLPDGRTAMVSEAQQEERPSRLYAVLMNRTGKVLTVKAGAEVDPKAALPVALRMPDAQGWVVAAYGSHLRYRTSTGGGWLDGGDNAALLPDAATEVRVERPGKEPAVVTLRR